jgi:iron(III) transport system ATP-binding protein
VTLTLPAGGDPEAAAAGAGTPLTLAIRPEEIVVGPAAQGATNRLAARIRSIQFLGSFTRLVLALPGDGERVIECDVAATAFAELGAAEGGELALALPPESLRVFRKEG